MGKTELASKRKASLSTGPSRKKIKAQHHSADKLPWKLISRPFEAGVGGDDGILELEEVDNVEVVYEDTENGRVVKFNVIDDQTEEVPSTNNEETDHRLTQTDGSKLVELEDNVHFDGKSQNMALLQFVLMHHLAENLLPEWKDYQLHPMLLRTLYTKKFLSPTPIQAQSIPHAITGRDIVGVAQTGSGKTLAYGLPILHYLLSRPRRDSKSKRQLRGLILAPTRELALQVSSHLNACITSLGANEALKESVSGEGSSHPPLSAKPPPLVSVAAIVGGMSSQKQRRILDRGVDVLVATPGRLWDIMEEDDDLCRQIKHLRFLVLDEADRMIEAGHYLELENILRLARRTSEDDKIQPDFELEAKSEVQVDVKEDVQDELQTFVYSATLSKDLQRNVKRRTRPKMFGKGNREKPPSTLDDLVLRLDFRDEDPVVIDLSPVGGVVSTLKESKVACLSADKDVYLYYFLLRYPGRSLVFLSSIDGIRRLMPLVELLSIKAFPLHSQLEQRQRLKNLDRFKAIANSVLLATDIAARGLDIPAVDHVIHYQIPRSADAYVHRNGRTARAMMKGFSMLMCAPDEGRVVRALLGNLGRQESDIPDISIDLDLLDKLKARVQLARQIEQTQHKVKKENHERQWMKETAEAMDIELDSDFLSDSEDEEKPMNQKRKARVAKTSGLKAELKHLLSQPLIARGISKKFITSGTVPIVDDLLTGDYNQTMVGLKNVEAGSDLLSVKQKAKSKAKAETEYEEWDGLV